MVSEAPNKLYRFDEMLGELRLPNSECIGLDIYLKAQVLASIEFCRVLDLSASTCAMTSQFGGRISLYNLQNYLN